MCSCVLGICVGVCSHVTVCVCDRSVGVYVSMCRCSNVTICTWPCARMVSLSGLRCAANYFHDHSQLRDFFSRPRNLSVFHFIYL